MGRDGGGSTLSQQLALNLYGKRASGFINRVKQKFGEWIIAAKLEKRYTKEEIMTMYFNKVDFLNQGVGIHSASKVYFSKTPAELNLQEAAMLVGMVKNPNGYNPKRHPEAAKKRREVVLKQMLNNDYINKKVYDSVRVLPLGLNLTSVDHKDGIAPYFRETLRADLNKLLDEKDEDGEYKYLNKVTGKPYNLRKDGLKVYTTIDSRMQKYAEWAVMEHLGKELQNDMNRYLKKRKKRYPFVNSISKKDADGILERAKKQTMLYKTLTGKACAVCERPGTKKKGGKYICNYNKNHINPTYTEAQIDTIFNTPVSTQVFDWTAKGYEKDTLISPMNKIKYLKGILRAGMMSMDPHTGFVKAWVGGPNFKYFQYDMVRTGRRQVGSTFKPLVYASAIDAGVTQPCDEVLNIEHCCPIPDNPNRNWCPKNAGLKFDGLPMSIKYGLAGSVNSTTAAVMKKIGPKKVRENAIKMGISGKHVNEYPSIALGACDLTVYEIVGAMSTFANKGVFIKPIIITRIEDKNGAVIYEAQPHTEQVFDENLSATMLKMMKLVVDGQKSSYRKQPAGTSMRLRYSGRKYGGFKNPIAGKTGTTQNNSDGWFIGLTPDLVSGVWVGGEDRSMRFTSTRYGQGANTGLPIWGYYMGKVYKDTSISISKGDFELPDNYYDDVTKCKDQTIDEPIDYSQFPNSGLFEVK
ncbi:MAG: transglycosylase domain-containing protein, partial [Flavobacteriales bacterium]